GYDAEQISDEVCLEVAGIVLKERAKTPDRSVTGAAKPGAAEFLDLVHALVQFADTDKVKGEQRKAVQREVLEEIKDFALLKSARD
ncbi:MAG: hypothetical protein ACK6EB_24865, partial [Planctomyces sp.]